MIRRFGFKTLLIISAYTYDAAHDWISRLKAMRRRRLVIFLKTEGRFV